MKKEDFSVCEFIERQMWFITYNDFCDRRAGIKRLFEKMPLNQQIFYKWYVYSNVHCSENFKNAIWDYLNFNDTEYELELTRLKRLYKAK